MEPNLRNIILVIILVAGIILGLVAATELPGTVSTGTYVIKQARGAARGLLGNALLTEMVWTCNIRAMKQILKQRANQHADAEIRVLANRLYEEALPYWPTYLGCYRKRDCPDGIGYELYIPDPRDEKLREYGAKIEQLQHDLASRDDASAS